MTLSFCFHHAPWKVERATCLAEMVRELVRPHTDLAPADAAFVNATDYRDQDWQTAKVAWALEGWRWSVHTSATHHVFMTDDLYLAPGCRKILEALVEVCPDYPIGLLSNHPRAPELAAAGHRWYRTNSWLVGPAYIMPHELLVKFLAWFEALPDGNSPGCKGYANDDSSINEWVTRSNLFTAHPLPTPIEHRHDIESTVGHGDRYSRERLSWRFERDVEDLELGPDGKTFVKADWNSGLFRWTELPVLFDVDELASPAYWRAGGPPVCAPLLSLP